MKGVKGKLLKKLKTIKSIGYLKPERILQISNFDNHLCTSSRNPLEQIQEHAEENVNSLFQKTEVIDVTELMKDLEDPFDSDMNDKENVIPNTSAKKSDEIKRNSERKRVFDGKEIGGSVAKPLSEIDVTCFRRPDLNSLTLFDPNLLEAFKQAIREVKAFEEVRKSRFEEELDLLELEESENEPPLKSRKVEETIDPLLEFQEKCPSGGSDSIILYTTGLRGIRKTFEDCHKIRSLLENLRVLFFERDISMDSGFKEEMWEILGGKVIPPRLFIKGRYIGGADEVLALHEQENLKPLIKGIPIDRNECACEGCGGIRFIICFNCNGSRKIVVEGDGERLCCSECNENGMVICPFCC